MVLRQPGAEHDLLVVLPVIAVERLRKQCGAKFASALGQLAAAIVFPYLDLFGRLEPGLGTWLQPVLAQAHELATLQEIQQVQVFRLDTFMRLFMGGDSGIDPSCTKTIGRRGYTVSIVLRASAKQRGAAHERRRAKSCSPHF
ncbi:hypothetical protein D9M68_808420 [compost metagenome]